MKASWGSAFALPTGPHGAGNHLFYLASPPPLEWYALYISSDPETFSDSIQYQAGLFAVTNRIDFGDLPF